MARQLSLAAFRALYAQETNEVFLICLTITHPSWGAPLRVVRNNENISRSDGTYLATYFDISMPAETPDRLPDVSLTIDNVDRAILDQVRAINGSRVKIVMDVVLASSPNTVEAGPFEFYLLSVNFDAMQIEGTLGFEDDLLNTSFPAQTYTPKNSPGLFR